MNDTSTSAKPHQLQTYHELEASKMNSKEYTFQRKVEAFIPLKLQSQAAWDPMPPTTAPNTGLWSSVKPRPALPAPLALSQTAADS